MPTDDITSFLPSIKLHSFPTIYNLSSSGLILPPDASSIIFSRKAFLECPTCHGIDDFYSCEKNAHYKIVHCIGNQAPEHEHKSRDILGNIHTERHAVACAGIVVPHFHVQCVCCEDIFFVALPERV